VVDEAGTLSRVSWLVEEDTTNGHAGVFSARTLGVNIHGTYAPVKEGAFRLGNGND
jgi:hypothetical protein